MSDTATALLELRSGWLVRVTEFAPPAVRALRGSPRRAPSTTVIGVISQVTDRTFRVGSLAEMGDGKSYLFKRVASPAVRVEILDRSYELEVEVVDARRLTSEAQLRSLVEAAS